MVVSALLGGLGAIGGTYLSAGIQKSANKDMLNRQMAFNAQQAQIGRQFQERMIRNAHQYEVEDLRKANLNPILSANGGASGASGASASVSGNGSINVDNPFTSWVNSQTALSQMQQAREQVESLKKGQKLTDQQIEQQKIINKFLPEQIRAGISFQNANTGQLGALTNKTNKEADNIYPANFQQFAIKYLEKLGYKIEQEVKNQPKDDDFPRTPNGRVRLRHWVNPNRVQLRNSQ